MIALPLQVKVVLAAVILAIFVGLLLSRNHYHNEWISAREEISKLQSEQAQLQASADKCSEGVNALGAESAAKANEVKKAQEAAAKVAKTNEKNAQVILNTEQKGDSCKAAVKLYKDYKISKEVK